MKRGQINCFESCVTIPTHHSEEVANTTYFRQNFVNMILPIYTYVNHRS